MGSRRGGSGIKLVAACTYTSAVIANPSAEAPIHQRVRQRHRSGGDRQGGINDRRPVALHPVAGCVLEEHHNRRQRQCDKQRPERIAAPPGSPCRGHQAGHAQHPDQWRS